MRSVLFLGVVTLFELEIDSKRKMDECHEHGAFENIGVRVGDRIIWSGCIECASEKIENENRNFAKEAERNFNRRIFNDAALPRRFESKTLESYTVENKGQENAIRTALEYVGDLERNLSIGAGLLFYGSPGTGKTHIAIGIALKFLENNLSVMYVRASQIAREIKETWSKNSKKKESEIYEKYSRPDLLIIDEIGRQFGTDTERMILFEVINARYEQRKPVLAVTNLDGAHLAECLGAATLDRLKEGGKSVRFDWDSMRPKI